MAVICYSWKYIPSNFYPRICFMWPRVNSTFVTVSQKRGRRTFVKWTNTARLFAESELVGLLVRFLLTRSRRLFLDERIMQPRCEWDPWSMMQSSLLIHEQKEPTAHFSACTFIDPSSRRNQSSGHSPATPHNSSASCSFSSLRPPLHPTSLWRLLFAQNTRYQSWPGTACTHLHIKAAGGVFSSRDEKIRWNRITALLSRYNRLIVCLSVVVVQQDWCDECETKGLWDGRKKAIGKTWAGGIRDGDYWKLIRVFG